MSRTATTPSAQGTGQGLPLPAPHGAFLFPSWLTPHQQVSQAAAFDRLDLDVARSLLVLPRAAEILLKPNGFVPPCRQQILARGLSMTRKPAQARQQQP